jgi:hypothetical protein
MKENPTTTVGPGASTGVTILPSHQALAAKLVEKEVVGSNAMADVIALLDSLRHRPGADGAVLRVGGLAEVSAMLHERHGRRTLQRILRLLLQAGILDRRLPIDCAQPVYMLDVAAFAERLDEVTKQPASK